MLLKQLLSLPHNVNKSKFMKRDEIRSYSKYVANFPEKVKIVEVGARDGLQNEKKTVPTDIKIDLVNRLSQTGLKVIEATAFVSPKWVPQMSDHSEVLQGITRKPGVSYPVLVPNMQGYKRAIEAGADEVTIFASASEAFSKKNIGCSIAESFDRFKSVSEAVKKDNIKLRGYVSCIFQDPFSGPVDPQQVVNVCKQLHNLGCYEISLGDTTGVGTPATTYKLLEAVTAEIPIDALAVHFHNTYGQALANIYAALQLGISTVDSSVAGLGGCPYAKGATGNVATEDVLYMLQGLEIETGVDILKIAEIGKWICENIDKTPCSTNTALLNKAAENCL